MKISYNWLKQYISIDLSPGNLSEVLTDIGLEVEGLEKYESVKGGLKGILTGKVISCEKHPNADKLSLAKVDIGKEEPLNIVCGAPNVKTGQIVPVATVGSKLFKGDEAFEIKKAKIRGAVSEGMICAEDEIGLGNSHDGIMILDSDTKIGIPARELFRINEDYVFEIGLTPNRTDAISHIGVARDLVAGLNQLEKTRKYTLRLPDTTGFKVDNHNLPVEIEVLDTEACPRYAGLTVSGIRVMESPEWLKNYLNAIGVRPINNIVDITNYVLFEYGQPLHAFDADKIVNHKVVVRKLQDKAKFTTLDEVERELSSDDLMICDAEKGMCIGGVFGGINSGINEESINVFLESAFFNPLSIRKTSKLHALQTDASFRFERGVDPDNTVEVLKRAALLIKDIAGGEISSEIVDVYPEKITDRNIKVNYQNVDRLIGKKIDRNTIKTILKDLKIKIQTESDSRIVISVPAFKFDVTREADVIEEILRIYGYNNIDFPEKFRSSVSFQKKPDKEKLQNLIAEQLGSNGFYEIMNNSLTTSDYIEFSKTHHHQNSVKILNALSQDLDILRQDLLFGGLEVIAFNQNRKTSDIKVYEFGYSYQSDQNAGTHVLNKYNEEKYLTIFITGKAEPENWNATDRDADFFDLKATVNDILLRLGFDEEALQVEGRVNAYLNGGLTYKVEDTEIAEIGVVHEDMLKEFDIKSQVYFAKLSWDILVAKSAKNKTTYTPIPRYPSVKRDLALLIDKSIGFEELKKLAFKTENKLLKRVSLFDVYEGKNIEEGKKSYALSFILQNPEKTLTDKIIDKVMKRLARAFKQQFNAVIR